MQHPFQSQWITIDGNEIHYVDEGVGNIILFSHAAIGSSFMYREFIKILRKNFRCIAMDYPGFGLSQEKKGYMFSISSQAKVLLKFIEQLHLQNITMVGHDSPSRLAVAAWKPDLIRALILTDTQIFPTTEYKQIHTMLGIVGSSVLQTINAATNFLVKGTVNFGILTRKLSKEEKQQYYQMHNTSLRRRAICKVLYSIRSEDELMQEIKNGFEHQLNEKPVLMIYGQNDPVYQLEIPQRIQKMMRNAELHCIKGERHFPHEAQPLMMSSMIENWMRKL